MKEFELQIRVRNNRLKERRLALGVSQNTMNEAIGLKSNVYHKFEMLVLSPFDLEGGWTPEALLVAEYFDVEPGELFPPSVKSVTASSATRALDGVEIEAMMSTHSLESARGTETLCLEEEKAQDEFQLFRESSACLSAKETLVLRDYFGIGRESPLTVSEISRSTYAGTSNAGQILDRALRKLQTRSRRLLMEKGCKEP